MFDAQYVFGPATRLQAQAIGEPGHRTFRLLIEGEDGRAAALWVEKEQLQALGLAVEQLLAEFQGRLGARLPRQPPPETFPSNPTVDFKVGRLALGQDESELESGPRYVLLVYDLEGTRLFVLPGVPPELKAIFAEEIEPGYLAGASPTTVREIRLQFAVEGRFWPVLKELEETHPQVTVGSYPNFDTKELTLRCTGADLAHVADAIAVLSRFAETLGYAVRQPSAGRVG